MPAAERRTAPVDPRERLLHGRIGSPEEYAHVLVDEAQDLSPMQWRMLGRRGRYSSWTVVGDAAQASWPDAEEAALARSEAFGSQARRLFHMDTNYRNAREIFDYAATVVRAAVPDADIPQAVRETGVDPVEASAAPDSLLATAREATERLLDDVEGSIAIVTPAAHAARLAPLSGLGAGRVRVIDPMSTKGLEYDATVIVDPDEITAESPAASGCSTSRSPGPPTACASSRRARPRPSPDRSVPRRRRHASAAQAHCLRTFAVGVLGSASTSWMYLGRAKRGGARGRRAPRRLGRRGRCRASRRPRA